MNIKIACADTPGDFLELDSADPIAGICVIAVNERETRSAFACLDREGAEVLIAALRAAIDRSERGA